MDAALDLLSAARRRYLLYHFLDNDRGDIDAIALQIAAWERETSVSDVSETHRERVTVSLVHNHLPRLADHGILRYDVQSGDVAAAAAFDDVRPLVDRIKSLESATEDAEMSFLAGEREKAFSN